MRNHCNHQSEWKPWHMSSKGRECKICLEWRLLIHRIKRQYGTNIDYHIYLEFVPIIGHFKRGRRDITNGFCRKHNTKRVIVKSIHATSPICELCMREKYQRHGLKKSYGDGWADVAKLRIELIKLIREKKNVRNENG